MKHIFFFFLFIVGSAFAQAQTEPCPVVADFEIVTDSIPDRGGLEVHRMVNKSQNFTSFKTNDPLLTFDYYSENVMPIGVLKAGYYYYKLIATNGVCSDTMIKMVFKPGRMPVGKPNMSASIGTNHAFHLPRSISPTAEGGYLVSSRNVTTNERSMMAGISKDGCVNWGLKTHYAGEIKYIVSNASGVSVGAYANGAGIPNRGLFKILDNGSILWTKSISLNNDIIVPLKTVLLEDNSILHVMNNNSDKSTIIARFSADGDVLWTRSLDFTDMNITSKFINDLAVLNDKLYVPIVPYVRDQNSNQNIHASALACINIVTGDLSWIKRFGTLNNHFSVNGIARLGNKLVLSGRMTVIPDPNFLTGVAVIDEDGTVEKSIIVKDPNKVLTNDGYSVHSIDENRFYLQMHTMNTSFPNIDLLYSSISMLSKDLNIIWNRKAFKKGVPLGMGAVGKDGSIAVLGSTNGEGLDPLYVGFRLKLQKFDAGIDRSELVCDFYEGGLSVQTFPISHGINITNFTYSPLTLQTNNAVLPLMEDFPEVRYYDEHCRDFIDSCSFINIRGPESFCSLSGAYTFVADRNKNCVQTISWDIPSTATEIGRTDNSITVMFSDFKEQKIYAYLRGTCVPILDSIIAQPVPNLPNPIDLGPDRTLCQGQTVRLSVDPAFTNINWSSGQSNPSLIISLPGKYWVTATDRCGNLYSDTVQIDFRDVELIDFAQDTTICFQSSIKFTAPGQLQSYRWMNADKELISSAAEFKIQGNQNHWYYFEGQRANGCKVRDSVNIQIFPVPSLNIGNDTSFCIGESVTYQPDQNFTDYSWNNGATTPAITVSEKGRYILTATYAEGCKISDTVYVQNVAAAPVPRLDKNPVLCQGDFRLLQPGKQFSRLLWQDGSTGSEYQVSEPGKYWVTVWDENNCPGFDTTIISSIASKPSNFLPSDSSICQYQELTIKPTQNYRNYLWSNGSTGSSLTLKTPGLYSLQVVDENNCAGSDTIRIFQKQCMLGLFVPNAFTPNNDGINDRFQPLLYGPVAKYELTVYNRFGQTVFKTNKVGEAWDGTLQGVNQNGGTYIYTIQFQLNEQPPELRKGSFLLIR